MTTDFNKFSLLQTRLLDHALACSAVNDFTGESVPVPMHNYTTAMEIYQAMAPHGIELPEPVDTEPVYKIPTPLLEDCRNTLLEFVLACERIYKRPFTNTKGHSADPVDYSTIDLVGWIDSRGLTAEFFDWFNANGKSKFTFTAATAEARNAARRAMPVEIAASSRYSHYTVLGNDAGGPFSGNAVDTEMVSAGFDKQFTIKRDVKTAEEARVIAEKICEATRAAHPMPTPPAE